MWCFAEREQDKLRFLKRTIKKTSENKNEKQLLDSFLHELAIYQKPLQLALEKILDNNQTQDIFFYFDALNSSGSFIHDPSIAQKLGVFFIGQEEDLGFYVLNTFDSKVSLDINARGQLMFSETVFYSRPFFLYWPKAIANVSSKIDKDQLPVYFTPWVHEFGHFLCYCVQEFPIMVAINILVECLKKRGIVLEHLNSFDRLSEKDTDPLTWQVARLIIQLSAINEAMAIWWEEQLLAAMNFNISDYISPKKLNNPYMEQLDASSTRNALNYIETWHSPRYYPESFTKTLLESISGFHVDKRWFLEE